MKSKWVGNIFLNWRYIPHGVPSGNLRENAFRFMSKVYKTISAFIIVRPLKPIPYFSKTETEEERANENSLQAFKARWLRIRATGNKFCSPRFTCTMCCCIDSQNTKFYIIDLDRHVSNIKLFLEQKNTKSIRQAKNLFKQYNKCSRHVLKRYLAQQITTFAIAKIGASVFMNNSFATTPHSHLGYLSS